MLLRVYSKSWSLLHRPLFSFGKRKKEKDQEDSQENQFRHFTKDPNQSNEDQQQEGTMIQAEQLKRQTIQPKYLYKSADLYDKYLQTRQRPVICKDNYQLAYQFVIERKPIFVPYQSRTFETYKNRYAYAKKTNHYVQLPKDLRLDQGDYVFKDYDVLNDENYPTYEIVLNANQKITYRSESRLWRYTDPNIKDPHSIQTYSSNNVFLIVKEDGQWRFPWKLLSQNDSYQGPFKYIRKELFSRSKNPEVDFGLKLPVILHQEDKDDLERGKGIRYMVFKGTSISGVVNFGGKRFEDYAWVPKPLLAEYFKDGYFEAVAPAVRHLM